MQHDRMPLMPKAIVAIGGGSVRRGKTIPIDQEIIRLSGKKHPRLLFLPTASSDSLKYSKVVVKYFGKKLGCRVETLFLLREKPSSKEIRKKIMSADIIYVGGGNTLMMMRVWRRLGVDRLLRQAYQKGIVLAGVSAGSLCWFRSGHSDSMSFYTTTKKKKWKYIDVRGLGLINATHCPHYDSETLRRKRRLDFQKMMRKKGGVGIAIEDLCAMVFVDDQYRVLPAVKSAHAYKVYRQRGKVMAERIDAERGLRPLASLLEISSTLDGRRSLHK